MATGNEIHAAQGEHSAESQTILKEETAGSLLTPQERAILNIVATRDEPPHNQRAAVLLALDAGTTQAEAGRQGGLSPRQARYWRDNFRQLGLGIFPDELLEEIEPKSAPEPESVIETETDETSPTGTDQAADEVSEAEAGEAKTVKVTDKKKKKKKGKKKPKGKKPKKSKKKRKKAKKGKSGKG